MHQIASHPPPKESAVQDVPLLLFPCPTVLYIFKVWSGGALLNKAMAVEECDPGFQPPSSASSVPIAIGMPRFSSDAIKEEL